MARLSNHVEMKAVLMLVRSGRQAATVTINNAPCGSEPGQRGGCHGVLEAFLPFGSSLTVLGTDAHGRPFRRVYHGKATE